jgi:mono/diheme cytochrome c family protein
VTGPRVAVAIAALLAAALTPSWGADIRLPEGPGADLVYAKCRTCHDLQYVVDAKGLVPAQWRAVIAGMHDYGLTATKDEDAALLQYLTAYLGPNPPPAEAKPAPAAAALDGRALYAQNCATCHGPEGQGQPGLYPPLARNPDLARDDASLPVAVELFGLEGPLDVAGGHYDSAMPAFGHLSDDAVAALVNYVRHAFGNATQGKDVTPGIVAERRAKAMTPSGVHAYRATTGRAKQ